MNEHSFIRAVHRQLPVSMYKWKINDNFQGGVADAYYSDKGGDLWIEYKYIAALPKRSETPVKLGLTGQQTLWLNTRLAEGRNVAVVVGSPQGHRILVDGAWNAPESTSNFIRSAVATKAVAAYIVRHTTTAPPETESDHASDYPARPRECQTA